MFQSIIGATLKRREGSERQGVTSFKGMENRSLWAQPARGAGLSGVRLDAEEFIRIWGGSDDDGCVG
ncbi:hypothetical protein [Pseudomonas gingeri]|uniref:Uncharacterized protein n=1 Tax=Pseudomonas gingeri TaxID=117681 RepID=A0A7Y7YIY9_9PSED|nr:hypothetical protein [Pseudomonas gingeri]NWB32027.1 hypothetical protein [Pseudomonas gingeri]NWC37403.1 hypothetical protein [Pseudomonas gingeri]